MALIDFNLVPQYKCSEQVDRGMTMMTEGFMVMMRAIIGEKDSSDVRMMEVGLNKRCKDHLE